MNTSRQGLPLLSGPPPEYPDSSRAELSCRKCNKEFNVLFTRKTRCGHCGYAYCSSCSDYNALMPRTVPQSGYEAVSVCAFCIDFLNLTASAKGQLRAQPLGKLKRYIEAYNIKPNVFVEKDDLVNTMIAARSQNGCLTHAHEEFYRAHSVPNRSNPQRSHGLFSRLNPSNPPPTSFMPGPQPHPQRPQHPAFARPDLETDPVYTPPQPSQHSQHQPRRSSGPHTFPSPETTQSPRLNTPASPPRQPRQRATSAAPPTSAPAPTPSAPQRAAPAPVPTMNALLELTAAQISALSVGALKGILLANNVNARLILEKAELVTKVTSLVQSERDEREREARWHQQEEEEMIARQREAENEMRVARDRERAAAAGEEPVASATETPAEAPPKPDTLPPKAPERTGLCVICCDAEANIAIVDCGHLCMCRGCSDLVMASSRECPLCRTRIITEQRLLRIFKT